MRSSAYGFTLIELMVVVTLAAILLAVGVPSFTSFIAGQRVKTASYDILSALTFVRSEAIKRNANVTLAQAAGGWQNGWSATTTDATPVSKHEAFTGIAIAGPTASLVYGRDGRVTSTGGQTFSISSSVSSGVTGRCVTIDLSGLPTSKVGSCS